MAKPPTKRRNPSVTSRQTNKQQPKYPSPVLMGFVNLMWHGKKLNIRLYRLPGDVYEIQIEDESMGGPAPRQFKSLSSEQIMYLTPRKPGIIDNPDVSILPQEIIDDLNNI